MTTLVTGGAGFIGSHLVDALLARGERVITIDNFNDFYSPERKRGNIKGALAHPAFTLVEGDIRDRALIERLFEEYHPERVAHLAAMANVRYSIERAPLYAEVNLQGTINLLDAARHTGVENFVFASTSSVYGRAAQTPFLEEHSTDGPLAPYPATKKACELMLYAYHNMFGLNTTALRFFNVYGPRVRPDTMAWIVLEAIRRDEEITLYDGGNMHRDWTHITDIVSGIVAALEKPLGYEILNLGRGEPVRLGDFVTILEELAGRKVRVRNQPAPASELPINFASIDKANRLLGYQPRISIREGLVSTWDWFREAHLNAQE